MEIRRLEPGDLPGLIACFERCYGKSYVAESFYDAASLSAKVASGQLLPVVAVDARDGVVGHMALAVRHPSARTADAGNTVVDPRHRGKRLVEALALALSKRCLESGFVGFHHYPTTAHPIMQRLALAGGGVETGVMLGFIPASTEYRELAGARPAGRLAAVVVYQRLAPGPVRELFVPRARHDTVAALARAGRLPRRLRVPSRRPTLAASSLELRHDARRDLLRVEVSAIGDDLGERLAAALGAVRPAPALCQLDLPLDDPGIACAHEAARAQGFFFCAYLPEWSRGDVLRLQRLAAPTGSELAPPLVGEGARQLLRLALAERGAARERPGRTGSP